MPILATLKVLIEASKVYDNIIALIGKYPPILIEPFLAAFNKEQPTTRRSYDFIVDLTRPTDIFEELKSYPITFPLGKKNYDEKVQTKEDRYIVNVVGRYNVGKTYVLRLLANINLGHSFTERTIGVSVSLPSSKDTNDTPMALIDTAGTRTPVVYEEKTFKEKSYERQDKGLKDREIKQQLLLIHNYFNLQTIAEVERVEQSELQQLFGAKKNAQGFWLSENFKHFVIAHSNSFAGEAYNNRTIENIRTMIRGANAASSPDVLSTILKEIELLLGKVLIDQPPEKPANEKHTPENPKNIVQQVVSDVVAWWGRDSKEQLKVYNKQQVQVELELKNVTVAAMDTLWFICPKRVLSNTVTLSKNLGFNQDGSIYVDFSSQFVPDISIVPLNDNGGVSIHIECPSCVHVTADQQGMSSILVQGEKSSELSQEPYLNTRRMGKFQVEISLEGLEKGLVLNISGMKTEVADGLVTINIPRATRGKKKIEPDEL
ncbi:unnamed protein product [Rotaria magnacalcarata]|uniref:G domain-containing protein n=1 Tax=Rotaria magnacalcarata TaxID=392030 RepID=A0A815QSL9_9BILA|nr:unnamed protein product [Rotaria magnacalcarata]CAF3869851.1 unnamed protein product [Rotaria magnacalcarata]CAF4132900.1 unnamed protein product [Rotaria magnacalcarata]